MSTAFKCLTLTLRLYQNLKCSPISACVFSGNDLDAYNIVCCVDGVRQVEMSQGNAASEEEFLMATANMSLADCISKCQV